VKLVLQLNVFVENGAIYTGIDLTETAIEIAKKRFEIFDLQGNIFSANIEELDNVNNERFYLIYSFGGLHHIPDIKGRFVIFIIFILC
jgi:2-polyprenyl-3-methyl-5-hydroxy-6-metoxy-1,4-benzoquinol methylase